MIKRRSEMRKITLLRRLSPFHIFIFLHMPDSFENLSMCIYKANFEWISREYSLIMHELLYTNMVFFVNIFIIIHSHVNFITVMIILLTLQEDDFP